MVPASRTRSNALNDELVVLNVEKRACRHGAACPTRAGRNDLNRMPRCSSSRTNGYSSSPTRNVQVADNRIPARAATAPARVDWRRRKFYRRRRPTRVYQASGTPAARAACRVVANDRLEAEELASLELASGVDEQGKRSVARR
jgi:hypothetical protein